MFWQTRWKIGVFHIKTEKVSVLPHVSCQTIGSHCHCDTGFVSNLCVCAHTCMHRCSCICVVIAIFLVFCVVLSCFFGQSNFKLLVLHAIYVNKYFLLNGVSVETILRSQTNLTLSLLMRTVTCAVPCGWDLIYVK